MKMSATQFVTDMLSTLSANTDTSTYSREYSVPLMQDNNAPDINLLKVVVNLSW